MTDHTIVIIEETAGIERINEPVTVGIPFPEGLLRTPDSVALIDQNKGRMPIQSQVLARWPDGSLKWVLFDFQVSMPANTVCEMILDWRGQPPKPKMAEQISLTEKPGSLKIDTGKATFILNKSIFNPFERVVVNGKDLLSPNIRSEIVLTDDKDAHYRPLIEQIQLETEGCLRTTLKFEGSFRSGEKSSFASFLARIHFFGSSSLVKLEFTLRNPRAAKHPGGLWDLGDPGSIYFQDLTIHTALNADPKDINIRCHIYEDPVPMDYENFPKEYKLSAKRYELSGNNHLLIYQDSSGGRNWKSKNHVNRNGEVKHSFRGYRVYSGGKLLSEGNRANPVALITDGQRKVSIAIQYFWQNFPKAIEADCGTLRIGLFPREFDDVFELQGGEQKTHIIFWDFDSTDRVFPTLNRVQDPLIPRATPQWYAKTKALPYLVPKSQMADSELCKLINAAIEGDNTFIHRREVIDEYGWRNFGELYADHEALGSPGQAPLVSHYNNQYDSIYGMLLQFVASGDIRWFRLANQLCTHVRDIDIYHTDEDRPEFNHGLFWHTEHYLDAQTATHRCFSKKHASHRKLSSYGGGPSLSHNYATGLVAHFFLRGDFSSSDSAIELATCVENTIYMETAIFNKLLKVAKKLKAIAKKTLGKRDFVQLDKIYGIDGPGRASGNALSTLIDVFILTNQSKYLVRAEDLILRSIHPQDDIAARDLLDVENRWMYTIFLQALGKYLDAKEGLRQFDNMWHYAKECLVNYARWMQNSEDLYLNNVEQLQFPTETWAAQDIRKCNVLLSALKYETADRINMFTEKARYFYQTAEEKLMAFDTKTLTRPIALCMQNGMMFNSWRINGSKTSECWCFREKSDHAGEQRYAASRDKVRLKGNLGLSLRKEIDFLKYRIFGRR